jgi:hypothetical protein
MLRNRRSLVIDASLSKSVGLTPWLGFWLLGNASLPGRDRGNGMLKPLRRVIAPPLAPAAPRKGPGRPRGSKTKRRDNDVSLADLILWVHVVDACLEHPVGGLTRAAGMLGLSSSVPVHQCIERLETALGVRLFKLVKARDPRERSAIRGGHISHRGIMLAEACACIEHLWNFVCCEIPGSDQQAAMTEVKDAVFSGLLAPLTRNLEKEKYGKIHEFKKSFWPRGRSGGRFGWHQMWNDRMRFQRDKHQPVDLMKFKPFDYAEF